MAELIVKYRDRAAEHFTLGRRRVTIGRSARNDLCVPDPFASRFHAEVRNEGGEYFLEDLGSANGTLHNGSTVSTAVQLVRGDRIQIGDIAIVFAVGGAESSMSDRTTAGVLEPIWAKEPIFAAEDDSEAGSDARLEPASVRLNPYLRQGPVGLQIRSSREPEVAIRSQKYNALIPLNAIFRFIHEPIGPKTHSHFVGRQDEIKVLAERILFSDGGSFLVTGYRGVGKTSFINEVIAALKDMLAPGQTSLGNSEVLAIHFNLARPLEPAELMHHIIRGIYQRLSDENLLPLLETGLKQELTLAFYRTSMNMTKKVSEAAESGFGLEGASLGVPQFKASLKTSLSYKRSRTRNDELTFLGYDDKAAEHDIIRISKALANGYENQESWYKRLLNRIQGHATVRTVLKLVFVFDELDKLEGFGTSRDGKDAQVLDGILGSLKNLFTTSDISFVFIAGKDLQERWLDDLGRGDSVYESIFSFEKYLPCMWSETAELCDRLIDWDQLTQRNDDQIKNSTALFEDFKKYLAYKGRGIPRRIIKGFNEHVLWQDGSPKLGFTRQDARLIRFYADLQTVLQENHRRLFGNLQEEVSAAQEDKRRLGIIYLVDWVMRQSIGKFTLQDAAQASKLLSTKIAFRDEVAEDVIKKLFDLLVKYEYLRHVQNPEDQTLVGGANGDSGQYELVPRRLVEMGSADAFEHGDRAAIADPMPGSIFGHYFLTKELAKGGMGHVFEGRDERNGRRIVVKMVASGLGQITEVNDRLKREARILAKLNHPNVVKYYDSGEDNGRFFLVMEFIDGTDLNIILRTEVKLGLGPAMSIAVPVAKALQYVHAKKLVRIDVKPSNILISKTGHVLIIDFGTAKSKTPEIESITQRGSFVGTPNYMSPEQLRGAPPDERSDIYSFGIVLYETVVGKKPFVRELSNVMDTRIFQPPPFPSDFVELPPRLEALIMRCLEADSEKRFQTMEALNHELEECAAAIPLVDLAPIVETVSQKVIQFDQFERVETNPSFVVPLIYEHGPRGASTESRTKEPNFLFLNGPRDVLPNGYPLGNGITIGRSALNDLPLADPKVSRHHTRITQEAGAYWIEDLNAAHKTLVNGDPIGIINELHHGDVIQIGNCVFEFREP